MGDFLQTRFDGRERIGACLSSMMVVMGDPAAVWQRVLGCNCFFLSYFRFLYFGLVFFVMVNKSLLF